MVEDLLLDGLSSDDAVFPADGFDAVEVSDAWMIESAGLDLAGELDGETVEVWVVFQESRTRVLMFLPCR